MDKKILIRGAFSILLILILSSFTWGIGVSPTALNYENVMKGAPNQKQIMLFNTEDTEKYYEIYSGGNTSEWFSFSEKNFSISPKSSKPIIVTVTPPFDIPNGVYEDIIYIKEVTNFKGGEGASVGIAPAVGVKTIMNISEKEIISGIVHKISAENNEIGEPIQFLIRYSNTGNVKSAPEIIINISKGRENMDTIEKEVAVSAGQNKDILIEWETLNQEAGDYVANIGVFLDNSQTKSEGIVFKILPKGALTKSAEVTELNAPNAVGIGKTAKIEVKIKNTGTGEINAKITGEIYLNDELVGTVNGDNVLVYQGQTGTLAAYFKPEKQGDYLIKSSVMYEGKSINLDDIIITVKEEMNSGGIKGSESSSAPFISLTGIILIIAAVVILILAVLILKKFK